MKLDRRFLLRGTCQGALAVMGLIGLGASLLLPSTPAREHAPDGERLAGQQPA